MKGDEEFKRITNQIEMDFSRLDGFFELMRVFHAKRQQFHGLTTMFMGALKKITLGKRPFNLRRVEKPINQSYEMEKD